MPLHDVKIVGEFTTNMYQIFILVLTSREEGTFNKREEKRGWVQKNFRFSFSIPPKCLTFARKCNVHIAK